LIVDASALVAIVLGEPGWEPLRKALSATPKRVPATTLTELQLVVASRSARDVSVAGALVESLVIEGLEIVAFESRHADLTRTARERYGKGNGRGGLLNFGDLMVYAVAKDRGEPLLCTGKDFASTDLIIHPASRLTP
jgi:ribonuclease VapC